jgi:hypothetical protein
MPACARCVCGQRQKVDPVEQHLTGVHLVAGLAHDDGAERALAGTVGTHDGVHLTRAQLEVDAVQDLLAGHRGDQALDLQSAHLQPPRLLKVNLDIAVDHTGHVHRHRLGGGQGLRLAGDQAERSCRASSTRSLSPCTALRPR